jgi:hypothetical protein
LKTWRTRQNKKLAAGDPLGNEYPVFTKAQGTVFYDAEKVNAWLDANAIGPKPADD